MVEQLSLEGLAGQGAGLAAYLRGRPEDQWFDRKSTRTTPRQLADLMIGFANAEGGIVALGFRDRLIESAPSAQQENAWRQAARDFTQPPVRHGVQLVPSTDAAGEGSRLVLIEVEASETVHSNVRGETYLRVGDENRRLGVIETQELRFDKGQSVFDGTAAPGATLDDLDDGTVERFLKRVRAEEQSPIDVLEARGLVVRRRKTPTPTVAGILLLGENPQRLLPEAELRLLRYRGDSRETGARSNAALDRRIAGPLPYQVETARRTLRRWIPSVIRLQAFGKFAPQTVIPPFAWLEAVVNALVHRSYSFGGDHVRVEVFDDRLEVESPGRLPGLVRVDNIRSTRFARNPRIARAMNDLGFGRELGEGVDRMYREMELVGLPDPVYTQGPASVRVSLLSDQLAGRILRQLPAGSERFAEFLTRADRVTTRQAADLLGVSKPTALNHLHALVELGLIEHVGTSLKDPRGFWRLKRGSGG